MHHETSCVPIQVSELLNNEVDILASSLQNLLDILKSRNATLNHCKLVVERNKAKLFTRVGGVCHFGIAGWMSIM